VLSSRLHTRGPGRQKVICCVLFDLDGTLIDSYDAIAESLNAAREAYGLPPLPREEVVPMVGHGLENLIAETLGPDRIAEGVRAFRDRYRQVSLPKSRLLPGVEATVRELKSRGYRLAVVTNKPSGFSRRILDHLGVGDLFRVVYGPDRVAAKPDPEMVFRCLDDLGCRSHEAVLVGDMRVDRDTARNAGTLFFAVATGSESREALLSSEPDRLLDRFEDLLAHLPPLSRDPLEPVSEGQP